MNVMMKSTILGGLALLAMEPLSTQADVYGPKPFYEILDAELTTSWSPSAISTLENRKHVILLDAASQSFALSISPTDSTTLTVTAATNITATYGSALRSMFQILDRNATTLATETLTSTYSIHPELFSYNAIDAGTLTGSSAATSLIVRDTGSYYRDDQSTVAYLIFTFTGTPSSTKLKAATRLILSGENYVADPSWSAEQWLTMDGSSVGLTAVEASATAFLLADATDLIDFNINEGSDFNPASISWQSNSFAAFPIDSATGEIASWDFDESKIFEKLPGDVDDFYEAQFGDSEAADTAAAQALDAIETTLAAEGASMRYDKSIYLAYRENALNHRFGAHDIYNAKLGERTVAHVYFVNAKDDGGLYHPFMVIISHDASGGPNFLIDVARPPGDGAAGTSYANQTITRRAILENRLIKIPLKDYGLITNVADNDLAALGLATLASDENVAEAQWDTLNHAGTSSTAVAIDGVVIYPAINNTLVLATSVAEITASGIHVGRGLGLHYHADGHGFNGNGINLYNIADYDNHTHPPIIGFAYDGVALYGKYESAFPMDGDAVSLDEFGGHSHGDYGYHYHAHQQTVTQDPGPGPDPDLVYDQHFLMVGAWKGDVNSIPGFAVRAEGQLQDNDFKKYVGGTGTATAVIPTITTQPQDVSISSGDATLLTVTATEASAYQWYTGESGDTSNSVLNATSSSLSVQPSATSLYWVKITGTEGFAVASDAATVTVAESTYETWAAANIPAGQDATLSGDPDSDHIANLIEYALGLDPTVANENPVTFNSTFDAASYVRPEGGVDGILYILQFSTNLVSWATLDEDSAIANNGFETVTHTLVLGDQGFVRLMISQ